MTRLVNLVAPLAISGWHKKRNSDIKNSLEKNFLEEGIGGRGEGGTDFESKV